MTVISWLIFGGILVIAVIGGIVFHYSKKSVTTTPLPPTVPPVTAAAGTHPAPAATPATPPEHDDDHDDHHHAHASGGSKHTGWWILVFFILGVLLIVSMHILGNKAIENKLVEPPKKEKHCYYCVPGALLLQQEHIVQIGEVWTSEFVDYVYKFRSEKGSPYMIKFTGMKHFVLMVKDGGLPPGAKPGPVQIKLPDGANESVKIQLYRICQGEQICT